MDPQDQLVHFEHGVRSAIEALIAARGKTSGHLIAIQRVHGIAVGHPEMIVVRLDRDVVKSSGAIRKPGADSSRKAGRDPIEGPCQWNVSGIHASLDNLSTNPKVAVGADWIPFGGPGRAVPRRH